MIEDTIEISALHTQEAMEEAVKIPGVIKSIDAWYDGEERDYKPDNDEWDL